MTFNDIFKSSFLEKVSSFSLVDALIALAMAFAIGLFIHYVYRKTYTGVLYSNSFGVSLMAMTMITTVVILAVTSNVVLSLGMVGALSIVRFRAAIKEPMDIAYLFWAIAAGIILGAGLIPLAVIGSLCLGLLLMAFVNKKSQDTPYILLVSCDGDASEESAQACVKAQARKSAVKTKTVGMDGVELTMEVRLAGNSTDFVNQLAALPGVQNAVLVSYNGEYMA